MGLYGKFNKYVFFKYWLCFVCLIRLLFSFESICFKVSDESDRIRLVEFVRNSSFRLECVLKLVNDLRDSKSLFFV